MKNNFQIIVTVLFVALIFGCSSWKEGLKNKGNSNDAIYNAIWDFVNTGYLHKKDTVFSVMLDDISENIIGVSILRKENKYYPDYTNKVGSSKPNFPTRYLMVKGKLFIWYDPNKKVSQELIHALSEYDMIDSLNVNGFEGVPNIVFNDKRKGVHYYFCKNNILSYKKVRTSVGMGYYEPPELNCK
ncbi:MAG: hypothetical protein ACQETE_13540 [Bacteroidota bacterium]